MRVIFPTQTVSLIRDMCPCDHVQTGTDSMLLGAWVHPKDSDLRILDVGTGTGAHANFLCLYGIMSYDGVTSTRKFFMPVWNYE